MMVEQFIDRLAQQGLLDKEVIADLRRRVARAKGKQVTPEAVAKYLVDKGHLTRFQATKLVNEIISKQDRPGAAPGRPKPADDELRLADEPLEAATPLGETRELAKPAPTREPRRIDDEVADLTAIDLEAAPSRPAAPTPAPSSTPSPTPAKPVAPPPPEPPVAKHVPPAAPVRTDETLLDEMAADLEQRGATAADQGDRGGLFGGWGRGRPARLAQRRLEKSSEWDSMLLLVGGASLGVLLVIGTFLFLSLTRGAAEDLMSAAESAYKEESYGAAIKLYDKFLGAYPRHEKASYARVRRETARLRQVFQNPDQGLQVALEALPNIEGEESFPDVRDELASVLPQIARGFVNQAKLAKDSAQQAELLRKTQQSMELVNNRVYIPDTQRKSQLTMIGSIVEDMARVQREIDRERKLGETIAAIDAAVAAGDTFTAYTVRQELLNEYPGMETDDSLFEAVLKISEKERDRVGVARELRAATTEDPVGEGAPRVVLSHRMGTPIASVKGHVVFVLADGAVFGLDASTGDVLWRRFVGFETTSQPIPLSTNATGADALVVDRRSHSVMRLDGRTGGVLWQLAVGEAFADPVVADERVYVATRAGTVHVLDAQSGDSQVQVTIPQRLETGPGRDQQRPQFYQVAEQDNLYVVSTDTWECREVYYIGHKRGTISVPPVMTLGHLFVFENAGPDFCYLHVIQTDEQGLQLKQAQPKIRLQGQVLVPPSVGRRRVLAVTDRRAVELYDVDPNNESGTPVISAGRHHATAEAPVLSYSLLEQGYLWVANNRLTKYQVQASTGKLPAEWVLDEQDRYVAPLQMVRDVVVHVRQRQGTPGYTVSAVRFNDKDPSWQTELAVPVRGTYVRGDSIEWVTARGRLYVTDRAGLATGLLGEATASAVRDERLALSLGEAVDMGGGRSILAPAQGYNQIAIHQLEGDSAGLKLLALTVPPGDAALAPVPFAGGLLIPLRDGRVLLTDPTTGAERAQPFHPDIEAGSVTDWNAPAILSGGSEFVIAASGQRLFRVGLKDRPQLHLSELGGTRSAEPLVGPLAAAGSVVFGVTRSAANDSVFALQPTDMKIVETWPLEGRVLWGPRPVGDLVLLATGSELACWDATATRRWTVPLEDAPVVGQPVREGDQLVLTAESGTVWRLDVATGGTLARADAGEPIAAGGTRFGDQWLVPGRSGVVLVVADPSP